MSTSVSSYRDHEYSGPKRNINRVRAQLKRFHNENENCVDVWRKKKKQEPSECLKESGQRTSKLRTYEKKSQCAKESKPQCPVREISSPPVTKTEQNPQQCRSEPLKPLDINWPFDPTLSSHQLTIEAVSPYDLTGLTGNRFVDIQHVIQWAFTIEKHRAACPNSTIKFDHEIRNGFNSMLIFECTSCKKVFRHCNEDGDKINKAFVWGVVTGGGYYTQAAHITNVMDIPTMSSNKFREIEESLGEVWMDQLTEEIKKNGEKEKAIAIEKGHVSSDGIPYTTVYIDGGWAKRSYGHDYNSASGMACIIGKNTKKCLYIGVKNKYCFHCHLYEKEGKKTPEHKCFKNYEGPSTGMETKILVEGFQKSIEMHGMRYLFFIGDGDSSVYANLKEKVSYGKMIKKTECKNHVIKNYTSALYKILANTKLPLYGRQLLKAKLNKLTTVSRSIIAHKHADAVAMRKDLQNGPLHVFGKHDDCKSYYCKFTEMEPAKETDNKVEDLKQKAPTVWALICAANEMVMSKANRLSNETTNYVENFMSIISKFNCGKRLNLHKRGSYERRVHIAGLSQVTGQNWHSTAWEKCTSAPPGENFKKYINQTEKSSARKKTYTRRRVFIPKPSKSKPDKSYGPAAQDVADPVDIDEVKRLCSEKISEYQKSVEEIISIEETTIGQHENELYTMYRSDRLTASHFGLICKRRKNTPCHNHVKTVLYRSNVMTNDMMYGQQNESVARTLFVENYNKRVRLAGLFIDEQYGFLGASPDGVVLNENAILEIKCFPSLARNNQTIETAAAERKNFPIIVKDGVLEMNKKHSYYYQVQGQLRVTKKEKCYFIGFTTPTQPITVIEILRDDKFIDEIVPKLVDFFRNCVLPEIILRRVNKGAQCIDLATTT